MRRALRLAARAWGRTSPNPLVGAVLVRGNRKIAEGWHRAAGGPHAEVYALQAAAGKTRGADLYLTLEPCSTAGRTPPCTQAIIRAGVQRVVLGSLDPNPEHCGRGVDLLREAGIEVALEVERRRCEELNEAFNCWIRHHRPYVLLKLAMTLDGRIATSAGESRWVSGERSRARTQKLRQWADAILVGAETVRRDNPQLLVRRPRNWPKQPLRLVASRSGNLGKNPQLLSDGRAETRILDCPEAAAWHAELRRLGREGIAALLVEGGGELAGELLRHGLIDKVAFFMAPKLLGGRASRPAIGGDSPAALAEAHQLKHVRITRSGEDYLITGYLTDVHRYS